jgi:hypothetical protein
MRKKKRLIDANEFSLMKDTPLSKGKKVIKAPK